MFPKNFGEIVPKISVSDIIGSAEHFKNRLYDRKVLVFKGLKLTPQEFIDVHKAFGRPWPKPLYSLSHEIPISVKGRDCYTVYSNVLMKKSIGDKPMSYHRDIPYHRAIRYPIRSLYPTVLPKSYITSTQFTDADILWERCSPALQAQLPKIQQNIQSWYSVALELKKQPMKLIPLVEFHPHTKRQSIVLNAAGKTTWVQELRLEGEVLPEGFHEQLISMITTPDNVYVHQWELGDLVLFDNWSGVLHGRKALGGTEERAFWRLNVKHNWQL